MSVCFMIVSTIPTSVYIYSSARYATDENVHCMLPVAQDEWHFHGNTGQQEQSLRL